MALIEIHDAAHHIGYVTGEPEVEYGINGNVLVHFPVDEDEQMTLSFKSDECYQRMAEVMDRAYLHAREERSRALWPSLWAGVPT